MKIKLSKLWAANFRVLAQTAVNDAERCAEYARMPMPIPPIEVYGQMTADNLLLIYDGFHRVVASSVRGETEIDAIPFPRE